MADIPCPLHQHAITDPQAIAILSSNTQMTYQELDQKIDALCNKLSSLHIQSSDRIAYYSNHKSFFIILLFATARLNALICPLSTNLPKQLLSDKLRQLDAKILITDHTYEECPIPCYSIHHMKSLDTPLNANKKNYSHDQALTLLFTSGSTSKPKICQHAFANHYYSALGANEYLPLKKQARWLLSLPIFHVAGVAIVFRSILAKATIVIPGDHSLEENLSLFSINHLSLVPTQLQQLLQDPQLKALTQDLKWILLGGGLIPDRLIQEAATHQLTVLKTYGLTETASQVATTHPKHSHKASVLPYRELKIASDGEILLKGKTLFQGYLNQNRLEKPFDNGWFHTKDLGEFKNNHLLIKGRKDFMFISGGENIQPEEIEKALVSLEGIQEAIVVPYNHLTFGKRPAAFIRTSFSINSQLIKEKLLDRLPKFKIPDHFFPLEEITIGLKQDRKRYLEKIRHMAL